MFRVRALARFISETEGTVSRGCTLELSRDRAYELAGLGVVEILDGDGLPCNFETKEKPQSLSPPDRAPVPSPFLQPADGRPSASMTRTDSDPMPTPSIPAIKNGGDSTPKRSRGRPRRSGGVVTSAPPASSGSSGSDSSGNPD